MKKAATSQAAPRGRMVFARAKTANPAAAYRRVLTTRNTTGLPSPKAHCTANPVVARGR